MRSIILLGLLLAACGQTASVSGGGSRCQDGSAALSDAIAKGLTVTGGSLRAAQAVRSSTRANTWFVAADIQGPSLSAVDDLAVWATDDLTGAGKLFAADAFAREWSKWEDLVSFEPSDDGYAEARACVTAKLR